MDRFSDHFLADADPQSLRNYVRKLKNKTDQQGLAFADINILTILPPSITQIINQGGAGDVTGPASAVDGNLAAFDGTTGKQIKDSEIALSNVTLKTHDHTGGDGAQIDHGGLAGLADDDHTQYQLRNLLTTLGDMIYATAASAWARLAGNTTTTRKFLRQTGTGAASAAPAWDTLQTGDIPDLSATYAPAAQGVTGGNSHDHVGGDGAQIDHGGLAGLADDDHTQYQLKNLLTTLGDMIYATAASTWARLAGNTTTTRKFLRQTGTGAASAAPAWDTLQASDIPADAVSNDKLANMPQDTIKGRIATGTGDPEDLTPGNVVTMLKTTLINVIYPVGSIYTSIVSTNPGTLFGVGTWVAFGAGRVLVGINGSDADFDTAEETGGAKTHTLTSNEMPSHTHVQNSHYHGTETHNHRVAGETEHYFVTTTPGGGMYMEYSGAAGPFNVEATTGNGSPLTSTNTPTNQNTGGGAAHNNMPPYVVVYMWKRTA